jgi:phasin
MLNLLLKSFWWAAWWPVSTWLLLQQKAAGQAQPGFGTPQQRHSDRGKVQGQESNMADDAFMKPELPESLRNLMKMSIEQAKRAFETFAATSENTWKTLESSSQTARTGLRSLNEKIAEITRNNAEANFALALKLAESKDVGQAMELQTEHARKQMDAFVRQLEEIRDLAAQVIQDSTPPGMPGATSG